MTDVNELTPDRLRWRCDPDSLDFKTTDELADLQQILGQQRALDAVQFGITIRSDGYNMFVLGPPGLGKRTTIKHFLAEKATTESTPSDWVYVHNFQKPHCPLAIDFVAGRGNQFRQDMAELLEDLRTEIPSALQIEEHQNRINEIEQQAREQHEKAFKELAKQAESQGIQLVRTPSGYGMAPIKDGEVIGPEDFEKLSPEERKQAEVNVQSLQEELKKLVEKIPKWRKKSRDSVKELNQQTAKAAIDHLIARLRDRYAKLPRVLEYLDALEQDVVEHTDDFLPSDEPAPAMLGMPTTPAQTFDRYEVNLLVDNALTKGAPVVFEDHPSYQNLLGRVEHESQMGTWVTRFALIKPGALHKANGGYLVLDVHRLLQQPYAWDGMKRALAAKQLKVESLGESLSLVSTVSLQPEPIPLDVKVILVGDRMLYYLLCQYDPDFGDMFKVAADFDEQMARSEDNCQSYARFVATLARQEKHLPFDKTAVAGMIEHSARVAGDSEKLSASTQAIADLVREANYWATRESAAVVTANHVRTAVEKQVYRSDRVRELVYEQIQRGTVMIDTDAACVGQVNGLSVLSVGNFMFGQPSRITAKIRIGKGELIDIEREVELGGAIHTKGVLILSSFLASRFATSRPLSLSASLVFEQSYGRVDGDSASVAEICALLSALSGLPIKQSLAVTGSVNQHGQVQPIGGVNEKIEGFFDVCAARGLTGQQGVLIPHTNVQHLMLRHDVVEAVADRQFHVWAVAHVDEAVALLTGTAAGQANAQGVYPADSVNGRVAAKLDELFRLRQQFTREVSGKEANDQ